ncbi:MAG: hypothetical protein AB1486_23470 [Planctomycetota bacterium]
MPIRPRAIPLTLLCLLCVSCTPPPEAGDPASRRDPALASTKGGPEFLEGRLRIYTVYTPQVQRRDFNGVFDISPSGARIVRQFWKERFNELTRPGHYGEYFIEFYDYMASLAQSYERGSRAQEVLLDSLEKSFHTLCLALSIAEDFEQFRLEQERILEGGR